MIARIILVTCVFAATAGCTRSHRAAPPARDNPDPVSTSSTDTNATPPPIGSKTCASLMADFERILARPAPSCANDQDCGCYSGGMGPRSGCGGVTHRKPLARLNAIWKRFQAAGCRYDRNCAPWACRPACREGKCTSGR